MAIAGFSKILNVVLLGESEDFRKIITPVWQ